MNSPNGSKGEGDKSWFDTKTKSDKSCAALASKQRAKSPCHLMNEDMTAARTEQSRRHWSINDIDFNAINDKLVRHDQFLFITLVSASFVEIHSEQYADNLICYFQDNPELTCWLANHWRRDEVQHGKALKAYVQQVWPEFDWERAYLAFGLEYGLLCTVEQLEKHKGLELIARCVVETGTSSFYRAMQNYVQEPVLTSLIEKIRTDEISHYTQFRRHFLEYNTDERHSVVALTQTIWRRLKAISNEDAYIAFKHVHSQKNPVADALELRAAWDQYNQAVKKLSRHYYPHRLAIKMLVKPIPLPAGVKKMLALPLTGVALMLSYS